MLVKSYNLIAVDSALQKEKELHAVEQLNQNHKTDALAELAQLAAKLTPDEKSALIDQLRCLLAGR